MTDDAALLGMKCAMDTMLDVLRPPVAVRGNATEPVNMTSTRPSMKEIEDAADEALSEAQDREAQLDQREAGMSGQVEDLEADIDELNMQLKGANALVAKLEAERDELQVHVRLLRGKCKEYLQNVLLYVGNALDWIKDQEAK